MSNSYRQYPRSVKELADQIKIITNDYTSRAINNNELREAIQWFAVKYPDKLFNGDDYNPTVKKIIGKRRINLLNTILNEK